MAHIVMVLHSCGQVLGDGAAVVDEATLASRFQQLQRMAARKLVTFLMQTRSVSALSRHRRRHVHRAGRGVPVLQMAVILSTGTPIPAQWTWRRRRRDRADIELMRGDAGIALPAAAAHGRSQTRNMSSHRHVFVARP